MCVEADDVVAADVRLDGPLTWSGNAVEPRRFRLHAADGGGPPGSPDQEDLARRAARLTGRCIVSPWELRFPDRGRRFEPCCVQAVMSQDIGDSRTLGCGFGCCHFGVGSWP
ncbi:hypothetical protein C1I92_14500 [Jiangella anatolica]|uniref:Uncharacterized protein n=1 Tax=Jiangella anatolica TaxID=2670374 RepID=A0A2W2C415_9ACTN|nr:hypothetical protein C1I92_14500 [Jiangella anatolica]